MVNTLVRRLIFRVLKILEMIYPAKKKLEDELEQEIYLTKDFQLMKLMNYQLKILKKGLHRNWSKLFILESLKYIKTGLALYSLNTV